MSEPKRFGDTELGQGIAIALVILAICLGIGSCCVIVDIGTAKRQAVEHQTKEGK